MKIKTLVTGLFLGINLMLQAQQIQPLSTTLNALQLINIFPADADKNFSFIDKTNGEKPATFEFDATGNVPLFVAEVFSANKSHYDVQVKWKSNTNIKKGDVMLARLSLRAVYAKQESGDVNVNYFVQQKGGEKSIIIALAAGPEWKSFDIPFIANTDMASGEAEICLSLGALAQKVEIANLQLLNFEKKATLSQMPVTRFTYSGREANAEWRMAALKRIEEIRTTPLQIQVVNTKGKPVAGAKVEAKLVLSDFIWGSAAKEDLLGENLPDSEKYKKTIKEFFNTAVIENGLKGPTWDSPRQPQTKRAFEWLEKEGFRQRGHNLVWMAWKFNLPKMKEMAMKDTTAFGNYIIDQIKERMDYTKGRVIAWDVINEYNHEREFLNYLPKDMAIKYYKLAKKLDPKAQLFMNEYSMLNSIESPRNCKSYLDTIASMRLKGAPIDAIGIQGHVGRQPRNPTDVLKDLDMFISTGLPVQITEFDINMTDEELQGDYTRDFLIACYSHPVISGFINWGFWQNAHWKPDAAMFRADWSPKPSAAVWRDLVCGKWKTSISETTNEKGIIESRGHFGKYEITVTSGKTIKKIEYQLSKNNAPIVVKL